MYLKTPRGAVRSFGDTAYLTTPRGAVRSFGDAPAYLSTPRGAVRAFGGVHHYAMGDDPPPCSTVDMASAPVGTQCTPDPAPTATDDGSWWDSIKSKLGGGAPATVTTKTATGVATAPAPSSPGVVSSIADAVGKIFGQQPAAPGVAVAPSSGIDTNTILLVGAVGVGAYFLLRKKKGA